MDLVIRDQDARRSLQQHCAKKGKLWMWPNIGPLACVSVTMLDKSEDTGFKSDVHWQLKFKPAYQGDRPSPLALISTRAFPPQRWSVSAPSASDLSAAKALSKLDAEHAHLLDNGVAVRRLTIEPTGLTFLVLPYQFVPPPPAEADADPDADADAATYANGEPTFQSRNAIHYKIFQHVRDEWVAAYESEGFPDFVGDLNGDGVPELRSAPCYCERTAIISFYPTTETLADYDSIDAYKERDR